MSDKPASTKLGLTAQVVAAYLSNNETPLDKVPSLINSVYQNLSNVNTPEVVLAPFQAPAVPVKKSVFPDFIVCLEDGKRLKMLKRHLQTKFGMTPDDYRRKWMLRSDYPMVAPNYAAKRSDLAKQIGLGRKGAQAPAEPKVTQLPVKRARGAKG